MLRNVARIARPLAARSLAPAVSNLFFLLLRSHFSLLLLSKNTTKQKKKQHLKATLNVME